MSTNDFLLQLLALQQDGKGAISAPTNWTTQEPLLDVSTDLDEIIEDKLGNNILQRDGNNNIARWHFFIGSPGNGKSAAVGKFCRNIIRNYSCRIEDEQKVPIDDLDPSSVPYALRIFEGENPFASAVVVQDASVVRNPFAPDVDPASDLINTLQEAWEKGISLLVCTNRGVLEKAYRKHYLDKNFNTKPWFKILSNIVEKGNIVLYDELDQNWAFDNQKHVFTAAKVSFSYLDNHSLLLGDNVFDRLIQDATKDSRWSICSECELESLCPFKANRDWLSDSTARAKFLQVMRRAEVLSGQIIVFREALAFLSYVLAGCPKDYIENHPCHWVKHKVEEDDIFSLAMRRIYMSVFGSSYPYGLENIQELLKKQNDALSLLNTIAKEQNLRAGKHLDHVLNTSPPSMDVGVRRLTGPEGLLVELDPWCDYLPQDFLDIWDGNFADTIAYDNPLLSEIEKQCITTWIQLEELIEYRPSHEAPRFHWAVRRWSSNFLIHFGGLLEGLTSFDKELDEYIEVLEIIVKDNVVRTTDDKKHLGDLDRQLETLITAGAENQFDEDYVELSEFVTLTGRWVSDKLRPKIDRDKKYGSLSICVKFQEGQNAALSARAFIWLSKHMNRKLDTSCFPPDLLAGAIDARVRASSLGENSYSFANDDVELIIETGEGKVFKLYRYEGDVDVRQNR